MDNKQKLVHILCERKEAVSSKELVKVLNVSDRMIRKYVKQINCESKPFIISGKEGYQLIKYPAHIFDSHIDQQSTRLAYILTAITDETNEIDISSLADELNVSIATIEQDIKQIKNLCKNTDLQLTRYQNVFKLKGKESEKRKLYKKILIQDQTQYIFDSQYYQQFFSLTDLDNIRKIIEKNLNMSNLKMNEFSMLNLSMHIGISVERISMNNLLSENVILHSEKKFDDHMRVFAHHLIKDISQQYHIELNEDEYAELEFAILSRVVPNEFLQDQVVRVDKYVQPQSVEFVRQLVDKISRLYHIDFYNELFIAQFALHIEKLTIRLKTNTLQENPLCQTIKEEYPTLFDIAVFIANEIHKEYHVELNQGELAFLVLHLGNAANDIINTAPMIDYHAVLLFPMYYDAEKKLISYILKHSREHLNIECYHDIKDVKLDQFDFILSVYPLHLDIKIPVLQIHPLPHEGDIDKIDDVCRTLRDHKAYEVIEKAFQGFDEIFYKQEIYMDNEYDFIHAICEPLKESQIIHEQFIEEVLERERLSSTYIRNGIAIPHSSGIRALKNFVVVIKNQKPILWGSHKVSYIILFGMTSKSKFLNTFDIFIQYQKQLITYINLQYNKSL
ncbi:BglG family transcription antiterminator [Absiella sp. AM29-15]|uniref:BglG family transcription antiterminator n=1 Tax=Absiella sp. AM29-15 TaxID=2292278 RepID=UPI001313FE6A|nr:PTS sugar transporter subunit IIA [Absiella sp. AM29-15]